MLNQTYNSCIPLIIEILILSQQITARQVFMKGDIILGGLFPVHEAGRTGSECGSLKPEQGIQRLQAMLYALEVINRDDMVLPNIAVGAQIFDTWLWNYLIFQFFFYLTD